MSVELLFRACETRTSLSVPAEAEAASFYVRFRLQRKRYTRRNKTGRMVGNLQYDLIFKYRKRLARVEYERVGGVGGRGDVILDLSLIFNAKRTPNRIQY